MGDFEFMNDLVRRGDVLEEFPVNDSSDKMIGLYERILDVPKIYDTKKVIDALEKERGIAFVALANTGNSDYDLAYEKVCAYLDKVIEIVKNGGE